MREYGLTLLVAAVVTYLLTPLVRRFAIAVGASHAARDRDVHVAPTPLLGGLAMYGGLAAGLLVAYRLSHLSSVFAGTRVASGLLLAGGLLVIVGIVDDRWGMGALSKLAAQVAAGVIFVWSGAVVAWLPLPGGGTLSLTADEQTALTVLVVVVTINAVNFIDGLDGLAAGVVGIGAAAFFLYYYTLDKRLGLDELTGPALASAVLAGVCIGFLPYNFHPAKIFMGDSGSMLIGLMLAAASTTAAGPISQNAYGARDVFALLSPFLLVVAVMFVPMLDLLLAIVRRTRAGRSAFSPDKMHLHHRLLQIGHSHRRVVLLIYSWVGIVAFGTASTIFFNPRDTAAVMLGAIAIAVIATLIPLLRRRDDIYDEE